jgi:hypothetical protein
VTTKLRDSSFLRRLHRVDDGLVYPTWPILLETNKERSGNKQDVKSVGPGSRNIWNAGIRILVRNFYLCSNLQLKKIFPQSEL